MGLLGFVMTTLYINKCALEIVWGRYSVLIEIVNSAYDLVYEWYTCQMYPKKLDKINRLGCQM